MACPEWTGVRLRDVLDSCGVARNAVYVAYESADTHLSGDPTRRPISRGVPVAKALEPESMIAWAMNGEALAPAAVAERTRLRPTAETWRREDCSPPVTDSP